MTKRQFKDKVYAGLAEVTRSLANPHRLEIIELLAQGGFSVEDIANARSIPIDQLSKRLQELSRRYEVVAYCRGPFCVFADEAVSILRKGGYKASRLAEGFPDWKSRKFPVEASLN